jgi:Adenylate and Guanylate cyclase catalytic domain
VMAVFPSGGSAAVRAAVAMQVALDNAPSLDDVRLGIGIHAGNVLLGTLGEPERFEATVISDVVNVASRIEGASKQLGVSILASDRVMNDVDGGLARSRSMGRIQLKGRSDAIEVVELLPSTGRRSEDARIHSVAEFRVALEAFRAGDHARAAVLFGAIVDANPEDAPALFYMVECQHRMANGVGIGPLKLEQK